MTFDTPYPNRQMHGRSAASANPPRLLLCLLAREVYEIPAHGFVCCRLWRMRTASAEGLPATYAIGLKGLASRRLCIVGQDAAAARRLFRLMVRHTVTPCALCDVLEEWVDRP